MSDPKVGGAKGIEFKPEVVGAKAEALQALKVGKAMAGDTKLSVDVKGKKVEIDITKDTKIEDIYNKLKDAGLNDKQIKDIGRALSFPWMANMDEQMHKDLQTGHDGVTATEVEATKAKKKHGKLIPAQPHQIKIKVVDPVAAPPPRRWGE